MKTKSLIMLGMMVLSVLTSCSEMDELSKVTAMDDGLVIEVKNETSSTTTRAAYSGLVTTFEEGDEIGVYAVDGTTAVSSNIKFTLSSGMWVPDTKVVYKDSYTYYAYYPYTSSPTAPSFATAGDENTKFASMISGWTVSDNQSTLNAFRANDLMLATGVHSSGRTVTFTMIHKMALAVVSNDKVTFSYAADPVTKYATSVTYGGKIPYFDGSNYYLFMQPSTLTTIGGQQLAAAAGKYITGNGGELTESYTWSFSTDGGETFSSTRPAWITGLTESRTADEPVNFIVTCANMKTTNTVVSSTTSSEASYLYAGLRAATPVYDVDLSMVDNAGNARASRTTANCYLVHAPGTYKIPLVYGNAIKDGEVNTLSFYPGTVSSGIARFINHAGTGITGPWITKNGSGVDAGMNITVNDTELLWQDVNGMISAVGIDGDYLTFTVSAANIAPGNALIAAKSGSTIVWSWHIWVTEDDLSNTTVVATGSHDYTVAPVNLGWVPTEVSMTTYAGSSCIAKLTTAGGTTMVFTVTQPNFIEISSSKRGCCTYYQWGRKDPFIPAAAYNSNTNHTVYNIGGSTVTGISYEQNNSATIGTNIKNPTKHYYNSSKYGPVSTTYYNMWDAQNASTDNITTATKKTIYDPCPPGFCVPTGNLCYYIGNGGTRSDSNWDSGKTWSTNITGDPLYFPAVGYREHRSAGLDVVGSNGFCWSATPINASSGRYMFFYSGGWGWSDGYRAMECQVRPVAEE